MSEKTLEMTANFAVLQRILGAALRSLVQELDGLLRPMRLAAE
jgi:hypothetical protein